MLEIDPNYSEGISQLGFISLRAGKPAEGLKYMQRVRELDPIDPDLPVIIATILIHSGFIEEAEDYLDQADAMSPNEVYAIGVRAYLLAAKGDYNTAGILAESLLLSDRTARIGSHGSAAVAAEMAFATTGQFDRLKNIVLAMEPNLNRSPENFRQPGDTNRTLFGMLDGLDEYGRALIGLGQEEEARALMEAGYKTFLEINPDAETSSNPVPVLILLGRYDEVIERLKNPENKAVANRYRYDPIYYWRTEPMRDHPGFKALMAEIEANFEPEREKIRAWLDEQKSQ